MDKNNNGGFHGYRKLPSASSSGLKLSVPSSSSDANTKQQAGAEKNQKAAEDTECMVREQDMFMPIANVIRIMRKILPPHAKISDDAKETIQECVSEYISFITGEANERCQREQRKTITAEDVLWAMSKLGFDDYVEPLTMYLHRYRELEGDRTSMRSDALGKRTAADYASQLGGVPTGFVPPQFHPGAYFGAPMGAYLWEAPNNNNNANANAHANARANANANAAASSSSSHHHGLPNAEPKNRSM